MKSMTAFGRGEAEGEGIKVAVELRTLNHRFLDFHFRMPRSLLALEDRLRKQIAAQIARGRVELSASLEYTGQSPRTLVLDRGLLREAADLLTAVQHDLSLAPWGWEQILSFPELISLRETTSIDDEALWTVASQATHQALAVVEDMRRREGEYLRTELSGLAAKVTAQTEEVARRAAAVPQVCRDRLATRLAQLLPEGNQVDPQRLAQEVALLADRADITEELARLHSHLEQFQVNLAAAIPIGRKLDFVIQEMNREINTIGSKAAEIGISQAVIEIKGDLERLREQVQNIE